MTNPIGALIALPSKGLAPDTTTSLLEKVENADRVLVLGASRTSLVHAPRSALSVHGVGVQVNLDYALLDALSSFGQAPRVADDTLGMELGNLTATVTSATSLPCVPMTVSFGADQMSLEAIGAGVFLAAEQVGGVTSVVAQTDLYPASGAPGAMPASTVRTGGAFSDPSPIPARASAEAAHAEVVAAIRANDLDALCALGTGPGEDDRGPLVIAALLAHRTKKDPRVVELSQQLQDAGDTPLVAVWQ